MNKKINIMYFSATDTTRRVVYKIADSILEKLNLKAIAKDINFILFLSGFIGTLHWTRVSQ